MNILLTSVGRRSYLVNYFKEALGNEGEIHVMNSTNISPAFLVADKAIVSPLIYDNQYILFLLNYCQKNRINAVVSLFDIDLPILAQYKKEFERIGTRIIVADSEFVNICNDKWLTYIFLIENGFNVPRTFISLREAKKALDNNEVEYPVIVKPRWGMGSISVFEAENEKELDVFYIKSKRNIRETYLKYESAKNNDESVLIQEKINGQEYGLDIMNSLDGRYVNTSVKMKYAMRSGETDCAITVDDLEAKKLGEKIARLSCHPGNLDVDIFYSKNKYYVLEMNARFGGGYPFSHIAGVNLPLAIVKWLNGEDVKLSMLTPEIGVIGQKDIKMVRL